MPLPRWIDIIIIGAISFILFLALTAFLIKPSDVNNWIAFIHKLPNYTYYSILILSGIIIQRLLHSVGDFTFKELIKTHHYGWQFFYRLCCCIYSMSNTRMLA